MIKSISGATSMPQLDNAKLNTPDIKTYLIVLVYYWFLHDTFYFVLQVCQTLKTNVGFK